MQDTLHMVISCRLEYRSIVFVDERHPTGFAFCNEEVDGSVIN